MTGPAVARGRFALLPLSIAGLFAPLNSTMIAVSLNDIREDFGVGVGAITWLVSSYLIAVAVCQPIGGRLGDAFGHVRVIRGGLVILLVFSVLSAVAPDYSLLVASRCLQGISAALIMPNVVAYIRRTTEPSRLASALGVNGAAISAGAAFGPVIGGLLVAFGGWRVLFWANVPLAIITLVSVQLISADRGAGRGALRLDVASIAALAALFTGFSLVGTALRLDIPALLVTALVLGVGGTVLYAVRYMRSRTGVVDLSLFSRRNYAAASAGNALGNLVMYTILVAVPIYFREVEGKGNGFASGALFAMSGAMMVLAPLSGRLTDRLGARPLLTAGGLALIAAPAGLALAAGEAPLGILLALLFLVGVAVSLLGSAQSTSALTAWPREVAGSASGTYSMVRYVGSIAGTAMLAAILGQHPGETEFRVLFVVLVVFAVGNAACGALIRTPGQRQLPSSTSPRAHAGSAGVRTDE